MNDATRPDRADLPTAVLDWIDRLCDRFEAAQAQGVRPRIEDYLGAVEAPYRPALLSDLLAAELDARRRRGERPEPQEYRDRFSAPGDAAAIAAAFAAHRYPLEALAAAVSRQRRGDDPETGLTALGGDPDLPAPPAGNDSGGIAAFGPDADGNTASARPSIAGFEVLGELGRGGMGVVYQARQVRLNRPCALKMIRAAELAGPEAIIRFLAEAEAIARLRHPHIVQIYSTGDYDGRPYIELEYVGGGSLADRLDGTPWPPHQAAALIATLAGAMAEAHRLGIVHRDLKPSNVLLDPDGTPKIADFGLAKLLGGGSGLTQTDVVLGTPSYMAPEQAGGMAKLVTPAADVYALGAVLYELLTGRPPFKGATVHETIA
jgi:hypothetical protein